MNARRLSFLALVFALALAAAACGGDDGSDGGTDAGGDGVTVTGPTGDGVTVTGPTGGITITGPTGGEVNIGGGDLPEGWPADFPIPDGATPAYSVSAGGGVSVWFSTDLGLDEVKAFFESALPAAGYTIDSQADFSDPTSGDYSVFSVSGGGWAGGIYMGSGASAGAGVAGAFEGDFDFFVVLSQG